MPAFRDHIRRDALQQEGDPFWWFLAGHPLDSLTVTIADADGLIVMKVELTIDRSRLGE